MKTSAAARFSPACLFKGLQRLRSDLAAKRERLRKQAAPLGHQPAGAPEADEGAGEPESELELPGFGTGSYLDYLVPGVVVMNAVSSNMWAGMGTIEEIERVRDFLKS